MYRAESEFSQSETRNRLPGADIATDQTKHSTLTIPRESHQKQPQKKCTASDPSLFKPSRQIQVVRPEKPKRSKTSINPNISLNVEPKG